MVLVKQGPPAPLLAHNNTIGVFLDFLLGSPTLPTRFHEGDAGYDLYVSREVVIPASVPPVPEGDELRPGFCDVHTDVYLSFPPHLYGRITGRSSTVRKRGLQVQEGIIDSGYTGELFIGVWNLLPHAVPLQKGDRIAQLIIHRHEPSALLQIGQLPPRNGGRGQNGFGSTGE